MPHLQHIPRINRTSRIQLPENEYMDDYHENNRKRRRNMQTQMSNGRYSNLMDSEFKIEKHERIRQYRHSSINNDILPPMINPSIQTSSFDPFIGKTHVSIGSRISINERSGNNTPRSRLFEDKNQNAKDDLHKAREVQVKVDSRMLQDCWGEESRDKIEEL